MYEMNKQMAWYEIMAAGVWISGKERNSHLWILPGTWMTKWGIFIHEIWNLAIKLIKMLSCFTPVFKICGKKDAYNNYFQLIIIKSFCLHHPSSTTHSETDLLAKCRYMALYVHLIYSHKNPPQWEVEKLQINIDSQWFQSWLYNKRKIATTTDVYYSYTSFDCILNTNDHELLVGFWFNLHTNCALLNLCMPM